MEAAAGGYHPLAPPASVVRRGRRDARSLDGRGQGDIKPPGAPETHTHLYGTTGKVCLARRFF